MRGSRNFFGSVEKVNGDVFWDSVHNKLLGENESLVKDEECCVTPDLQGYLTTTNLTTKPMNNEDKSAVFDILGKTNF